MIRIQTIGMVVPEIALISCDLTLSIAWSIDAGGTATEPSQEGPETETLLSGRKIRFSPMQTLQRLRRPISCGVSHKVGSRFLW